VDPAEVDAQLIPTVLEATAIAKVAGLHATGNASTNQTIQVIAGHAEMSAQQALAQAEHAQPGQDHVILHLSFAQGHAQVY